MKHRFFILILVLPIYVFSQNEPSIISLNKCIDLALQHHPDVLVSDEDRKIAFNDYRIAKAQNSILVEGEMKTVEYLKPDASATGDFNIPGVDTNIGLFAGMTAVYSLYDARKREVEVSSRGRIDISKLQHEKTKNDLIYNVKEAYYQYLIAREDRRTAGELYDKEKDKLKLSTVLFNTGQRPSIDVSRAEIGVAEAELQLERAENRERLRKLQLYRSMGISEDEIDISPMDIDELPGLRYNTDELYKLSELNYPLIQMVEKQKEIARSKIEIEQAGRYPRVELIMALGYENREIRDLNVFYENLYKENWSPAFQGAIRARFPIYSGGAISARVDSAVAEYNKAVYREREVLQDTRLMIRNSVKTLEELKDQLEMAEMIYENSQKHLALAQKSYESGAGTILELQDAEMSMIDARKRHINTRYQYLLTMANLSKVVGLPEELICE